MRRNGWSTGCCKYPETEETMTSGQTRRTALGAMAAGVGMASVGLTGMTDQAKAQGPTGGKTFVLVHGAWHGGWCWRRVSDMLTAKGHKVFTPTMTGWGGAPILSMPTSG